MAPLLTELHDVDIIVSHGRENRSWYHIEPLVAEVAIERAITELAKAGVDILIIPECAIEAHQLPFVSKLLRNLSSRTPISLSIIGVSTKPACDGGFAKNQAVILDRYGQEIARNDKLIRWNLSGRERSNLGFEEPKASDSAFLYENICAGDSVTILESSVIGRFTTLICADLIALRPSDWIRQNLCLDWTFTPLLDSSIETNRWMAKEASRAATTSRGRVIIANSIILQNKYSLCKGVTVTDCGVFLAADGVPAAATIVVRRMSCDAPAGATLVHVWPASNVVA